MKIYVNAIPPEGLDIENEFTPSDLSLETDHIHYIKGIAVKAHATRDRDIVTVNCSIKGLKKQICSRCLEEFDSALDKDVDFIYEVKGENAIELNDNIRDEILLDYPLKILCKPDCKGLCPSCGKNLNEGPCSCNKN